MPLLQPLLIECQHSKSTETSAGISFGAEGSTIRLSMCPLKYALWYAKGTHNKSGLINDY